MEDETFVGSSTRRRRSDRVSAACDLCKLRKVKCDGSLPCAYCRRKNRAEECRFSGPRSRRNKSTRTDAPRNVPAHTSDQSLRPDRSRPGTRIRSSDHTRHGLDQTPEVHIRFSASPLLSRDDPHEDTVVPLEARLLRDAQGKGIFIGDCAPLSFLQTVRHLIASQIDSERDPLPASRDSILEIARPQSEGTTRATTTLHMHELDEFVDAYFVATSGLVDLFPSNDFVNELRAWALNSPVLSDSLQSALYNLIFAIGAQEKDEARAEAWFTLSRNTLQTNLCSSINIATVQGFALMAIYLLRAFQPNGAYLYFSLAARTAYAVGLHRSEVNASFGTAVQSQRDRIWKSLRVVDMFISNLLGRPPSTSDVDCTVRYQTAEHSSERARLLDASVQMFMIIERVVVEVYSRKRISLRIASYVSRELKAWAGNWLKLFTGTVSAATTTSDQCIVIGACSNLCSYFYGIMLLTRPFLIYDLYSYLGASMRVSTAQADNDEKKKYADAALDAAVTFVEMLRDVINKVEMPYRMPLVVSWLFTTSLVLIVGVLGRSGLSLEPSCKSAVWCLEFFAREDPHARQYSSIAQALLATTTQYVQRKEQTMRSQRKEASSKLFGLICENDNNETEDDRANRPTAQTTPLTSIPQQTAEHTNAMSDGTIYDPDLFTLPWINENDASLQSFLQPVRQTLGGSLPDIPLFPIYDHQMFGPSDAGFNLEGELE